MNHFISFLVLLLIPFSLFSIDTVSVNASMDPTTLFQGWPIKGTLEITHNANQIVDEASVSLDGKPLKISLMRNVTISQGNPLMVSIYSFTIPAQNKGSYLLPPISVKIGSNTYKTVAISYQVKAPAAVPPPQPGAPAQQNVLKLEAFIKGPKELYPGQVTTLVYRYVYEGSIALTKETLPMFDAEGLQMLGRKDIQNFAEGNASVFQISQEVQALKPGEYSWGPSVLEGVVYTEDATGNKQYTSTILKSEAPPVKLVVKAFPEAGKPASFDGAFGKFSVAATLTSPAKVSVGDPLNVEFVVSGQTTNWDVITFPEICCQPGFAGFFAQTGLPPIGKRQGDNKHFVAEMRPLSSSIKSIPPIQFSYFESDTGQYKIIYTNSLPVSVAPMRDISLDEQIPDQKSGFKTQEIAAAWIDIYRQVPVINSLGLFSLDTGDLRNKPFSSWWVLWMIPLFISALVFQFKLKKYLDAHAEKFHIVTSDELYAKMQETPMATPLYFQLLEEALMLRLKEKELIPSTTSTVDALSHEGIVGEVRQLLVSIESERYMRAETDKEVYLQHHATAETLFKKLGEEHAQ